ncbi:MAG: hypothetical protein LQ349_009510 [Xanthoria aureola]|nr:MAG: hypothetical protein LQ349_009510 [Xanthoria aureola]
MKLSTLLLAATQITIALSSAHIASPSPDDEHGVLNATPEGLLLDKVPDGREMVLAGDAGWEWAVVDVQ